MTTEQERADFEAWHAEKYWAPLFDDELGRFTPTVVQNRFEAYQAGRAALQSQVKNDRTLFCDLKTDEEKSAFFLSGRGHETGVIAQAIQNDVAMAYHRCAEYKKELEALQSQDRADAERYRAWRKAVASQNGNFLRLVSNELPDWDEGPVDEEKIDAAIDHARRVDGGGG